MKKVFAAVAIVVISFIFAPAANAIGCAEVEGMIAGHNAAPHVFYPGQEAALAAYNNEADRLDQLAKTCTD